MFQAIIKFYCNKLHMRCSFLPVLTCRIDIRLQYKLVRYHSATVYAWFTLLSGYSMYSCLVHFIIRPQYTCAWFTLLPGHSMYTCLVHFITRPQYVHVLGTPYYPAAVHVFGSFFSCRLLGWFYLPAARNTTNPIKIPIIMRITTKKQIIPNLCWICLLLSINKTLV